jgi:protein phosphatase
MVMHSKNNGFEHCVANYTGGLELRIAAITNVGKTREGNEDNFAVVVPDYNAENSKALIVVADGMGGYEYGEVASEIVVDTYRTQFMRGGFSLLAAAREAHREIETINRSLGTKMGSTVVALHLHDRFVTFHHAGDSRLYRYANEELEQLTGDHSVVQDLVKTGRITPTEARTHPLKNIITNSIGVEFDEKKSDPKTNGLDHPERYLLCSDGLTDMLTDEEIGTILRRQDKGLDEIATELVDAANAKGGLDNITVAVVDVVQRKEVDAQAEDVTVTEGAIKSDPRHPDYTIQRGGLAEVVALFEQRTIRTTTGIQRARFKDASLKDAQLYAANYALYDVEEGEAVLYFGRQENNPILANPEEAVRQFTATGNYVLNPEQAARAKQSALRIKHSELDLQGTEEWQYFSIDTAHPERLNPAQRELAEAVHGLSTQFTGVMDKLRENGINATQIYVLNPEYIKRHAQSGALCRLVWIHTFGNNSSVDLMENRTAEVAMYGVLKPAEEVPAAVLDESISPATPTILETRVSFVDRYIAKIREDAARLKENYALLRTYFTSQEFKDQMQSARTSIEQKVIAVGDGFFETYMPEISRIIESGVARAGEYGLSLLSRERFKKGKAFLRKMALEAVAGISREVVENFTELLDSLQGSSVQDSSQKNSVSVTVEEDNPLYSAKLEEVATKYFASRHGRPYVDETAINAIKRYVEVQGMSRLRRLKPAFDFLRYTRGADALVAPLQEIRAHANLGEIVQQAYTLGDAIERTAVTVLARECGFVDMNEEKAVLAIDYIETAKAQRFSADEAKRQIVFLLETVPSLFGRKDITAIREGAANTHAGDFVEGVVAYLQGMQALGRDNAAAEDAFQTVLRRDEKYLRFVGIDMEEVYVGLARVYGERGDFTSLNRIVTGHLNCDQTTEGTYQRILERTPERLPLVELELGKLLLQTGRVRDAIPYLEQATGTLTESGWAHNYLGEAYLRNGNYGEGERTLERALQIPDYNGSQANARSLLQNHRQRLTLHYEAEVLSRYGHQEQALEVYKKILQLSEDDRLADFEIGKIYLQKRDYDNAIIHFRRTTTLVPDSPWSHMYLGMALLETGQRQEARTSFNEALKCTGTDMNLKQNIESLMIRCQ